MKHQYKLSGFTRLFFQSCLLLLLWIQACQPILAQTKRYVQPTAKGSGNGTSWANATNNLQQAIDLSEAGDTVWVAAGRYKPGGTSNTDRTISFKLKKGVHIYGGFVGHEIQLSDRPALPAISERHATSPSSTTLSGNIGDTTSSTDNSFHVISLHSDFESATLDRLVIANGQADGNGDYGYAGGAFFVLPSGRGASITLKNCYFARNYSRSTAGALLAYASGGSITVNCTGCTFEGNSALYGGGAVFIGNNSYDSVNERYFGNASNSSNKLDCKDCKFRNNWTIQSVQSQGGAVFINNRSDATVSSFNRCWFWLNNSQGEGGAIFSQDGSPTFKNCGFVENTAYLGGVLGTQHTTQSTLAQPKFTNCSFTGNKSGDLRASFIYIKFRSKVHLINSIIFGNGVNRDDSDLFLVHDTGVSSISATTSLFNKRATGYTGTTNTASFTTTTSPFSNTATLATNACYPILNNSNSVYSTDLGDKDLSGYPRIIGGIADLGAVEYQQIPPGTPGRGTISFNGPNNSTPNSQISSTTLCVGPQNLTINSLNDGFTYSTYAWQIRINNGAWTTLPGQSNVALTTSIIVASGQTTQFRRVVFDCDLTPHESDSLVAYTYNDALNPGGISGPALVPAPQEGSPVLNSTASATAGYSLSITWQMSETRANDSWADIPNSNAQSIPLPTLDTGPDLTNKTFYFRRKAQNGCASVTSAYSTTIAVTARDIIGIVQGKVVSGDGVTPVRGVKLTLKRLTTGLAGSPDNHSYTVTTGQNGTYNITPVYWGFESGTQSSTVTSSQFRIIPSYGTHKFDPDSLTLDLSLHQNTLSNIDFKDKSTYAISGKVEQRCVDCLLANQNVQTGRVDCPLDSVAIQVISRISTPTSVTTLSMKIDNIHGRYGQTVITPGDYQLVPSYKNFSFTPDSYPINVQDDVPNQDFVTSATAVLEGRLTDGCGMPIGQALLEFQDVPKKNTHPTVCFRKRFKTDIHGFYHIVLPARQYVVKVDSFTANQNANVVGSEVQTFFTNELTRDSLPFIRDLTSATAVTTLNLTYIRQPNITILGLSNAPSCGSTTPIKMLEQGVPTSLTVAVKQVSINKECPVTSGTVTVSGNVFDGVSGNTNASRNFVLDSTGAVSLTLVAGLPNLIAPFQWTLEAAYRSKYRPDPVNKSEALVVIGVKPGTSMFTTVSPALPYMVLHDPPGDGSYSYWEASKTTQRSTRHYVAAQGGINTWAQIKLGTKTLNGIGIMVGQESWGAIGGGLDVRGGDNRGDEFITRITATTAIQTSSDPQFVGPEADVYYGAAQNLLYTIGTEVLFDRDSCKFKLIKRLVMAHDGFKPGTEYAYTVGYIRNSVIPTLKNELAALAEESRRPFLTSQAKVWEDLLKNHEENRRKAIYRKTVSMSGGAQISESSTSDTTSTNTYEWQAEVDVTVGAEVNVEIAGNGVSGKILINCKTETGGSRTSSSSNAIATGFVMYDKDPGDAVAVDVKDDAVYQTPLFDVVAGNTSCPHEAFTQPRDDVQFYANQTIQMDVLPSTAAEFTLKLANVSIVPGNLDLSRTFYVSLVNTSNPDGARVNIGTRSAQPYNVEFPVTRGQEVSFKVWIEKEASSSMFSYENLQFIVTDTCGNVLKTVALSVFFRGECSNITFLTPEPDWTTTLADANILPVQIGGYTRNSLTKVTLEYRPVGQSSWFEGFTRTQNQLNNSSAGTAVNWNNTGLSDGLYDIRLKLTCNLSTGAIGTTYSQRLRGRVDRTPPALFGNTQPISGTFVTGAVIGATYDEPLACSRLKSDGGAVLSRTSNGQLIPVTIGCANNQIILLPAVSLAPYIGEVLSVTLSGVSDIYGNVKTQADSWYFHVLSAPAANGNRAVSLLPANQAGLTANLDGNNAVAQSTIQEDAAGTADFSFKLPQPAPNNIFVYFTVAGTARFGSDYTVSYASSSTAAQPLSATVNGSNGLIMIPKGASSVTMKIDPKADNRYEPDETVIISLLIGGDYGISSAASVTAVILNDDAPTNLITSIRSGPWEDPDTWDQERTPISSDQVVLSQNHTITLSTTGSAKKVTNRSNAKLRMVNRTTRLKLVY